MRAGTQLETHGVTAQDTSVTDCGGVLHINTICQNLWQLRRSAETVKLTERFERGDQSMWFEHGIAAAAHKINGLRIRRYWQHWHKKTVPFFKWLI